MKSGIGEKLKDLREYYEVSQRELCIDICSQKAVSKIEREEMQPSAEILQKMGLRLGVDISYFFEEQEAPRFNYIKETKEKIETLVHTWKYNEAMELIRESLKNPLFRKLSHRKFLLWQRSVCHFNLTNEKEEAIELLWLSMDIETNSKKTISPTDISMMMSMGNMHSDIQKYKEALIYFDKALEMVKKIPQVNTNSPLIKIYYNLALVYFRMKKFKKSIELVEYGIQLNYKKDSIFLLGEFYYLKGTSHFYNGEITLALKEMKKGLFIFEERGQDMYITFVKQNLLRFQRAANALR